MRSSDPTAAPAAASRPGEGTREEPVRHEHVAVSRSLVMVNAASAVLARLLNVFVLVWLYQYLLARISPEEFAVYPVVMAVMVFAPLFFSFFTGGVARYVVAASAVGDRARVEEIVSSILPPLAIASGVFLAAGLAFAASVESVLTIAPAMVADAQLMLSLLVLSFALKMCLLPFGVGFQVRQRFVELNVLWLGRDVLKILTLFALVLWFGPAVLWVVVASVAADLVHTLVVTFRSRRMVPELRFRIRAFCGSTARTLCSFGLWTTLGRLAALLYVNGAVLVLNRYGSAVDVVHFYFGAALFQQIQSMIAFAREPLQPSLVAVHALADRERMERAALAGGRYGLWAAMIVACPLAIFSADLVALMMEPAYAAAAMVLVLFMAIFPFSQAAGVLPMIAVARAEVRGFNVAALASCCVALAASLVAAAVLDLGAAGVAGALLVVTAMAQLAWFWPMNLRLSGTSPSAFARGVLWPGLLPALAGSAVWIPLALALSSPGWIALAAASAAGGLAYIVVLFGFCLEEGERRLATRLLERLRGVAGRARLA